MASEFYFPLFDWTLFPCFNARNSLVLEISESDADNALENKKFLPLVFSGYVQKKTQ